MSSYKGQIKLHLVNKRYERRGANVASQAETAYTTSISCRRLYISSTATRDFSVAWQHRSPWPEDLLPPSTCCAVCVCLVLSFGRSSMCSILVRIRVKIGSSVEYWIGVCMSPLRYHYIVEVQLEWVDGSQETIDYKYCRKQSITEQKGTRHKAHVHIRNN